MPLATTSTVTKSPAVDRDRPAVLMERLRAFLLRHRALARTFAPVTLPDYPGTRLTLRRLANFYGGLLEQQLGRTTLRSYPIKLTLEPINVCNLRCPACFTGVGDVGRVRSSMSLDLYRRLLAEMGDHLLEIEFANWGEPLLAKHLPTMIREAADRGITSTVTTNFSIPFDSAKAEQLVSSGLTVLGVSIDGARQETYQQYRVRGDLETVLRNCALVQEAKVRLASRTPRLLWSFHVFAHNAGDAELARARAAELGMEFIVTKGWTAGPEWDDGGAWRFFADPTPDRCLYLWRFAVVNNDGGVAPCCGTFFASDDMGQVAEGTGSFRDVWNGPRFREARGLYRARRDPAAGSSVVCAECPKVGLYHDFEAHRANGGTRDSFRSGFTTNDGFNFFWDRRRRRANAGATSATAAQAPAEERAVARSSS